jgi:hypothetical protein
MDFYPILFIRKSQSKPGTLLEENHHRGAAITLDVFTTREDRPSNKKNQLP